MIFLRVSSSIGGIFSKEIFKADAASSIRSTVLSGKNLSEIYLEDRFTAATIASSVILTPWKSSYFSFNPLRIVIASSIDGSFTITGWKRLVSAGSFSICF